MADDLIFLMGKYEARLPAGLRYARNHLWARQQPGGGWRFGFTTYAIRLMKDVYFLGWAVDAGDPVRLMQEIGHVETSKAESDLFAPIPGASIRFNEALLNDPTPINTDGHGSRSTGTRGTREDEGLRPCPRLPRPRPARCWSGPPPA
ncbi:MAG: glycine cleavage system protein H [Gemmataceae bacterium]